MAERKTQDPERETAKVEEHDWDDISVIRKGRAAVRVEPTEEATPQAVAPTEKAAVSEDAPAALLEEMKAQGITGAIIRTDGIIIHSTIGITDAGAGLLSSVANVTDALMKRANDVPKEMEITFPNLIYVIIPLDTHLFCGAVKSRDQKKTVREFADKARSVL